MNGKKIIALLLAIVMVLGLGTMASATAPNDKVQVNNMMVDASLYEAKTQEAAEAKAALAEETALQEATFETELAVDTYATPGNNSSYAPINTVDIDWDNRISDVRGIMQGRVVYGLTLYGAATEDLSNRRLTFTVTNREAMTSTDTITFTMGEKTCSTTKGGTTSMTVDLVEGTQLLNVAWTENGTARSSVCMVYVSTAISYPPIKSIAVDWTNSTVTAGETDTMAKYDMVLYGGENNLSNRKLTFTFSTGSTITGTIGVAFKGQNTSAAAGGTASVNGVTLTATQTFTVTWNETKNNVTTPRTATCVLNVFTPEVTSKSVNLSSVLIAGTGADYDDTTVGGVTRYSYTAALPAGTDETTLDEATVVIAPASTSAELTLKNSDGTAATESIEINRTTNVYTFGGVDFNAGAKTLTVTDGTLTRDYQVSASIIGQDITVYVAFRGYLADQWLNGKTDYYDYGANGYGNGSSLSASDSARVAGAVEVMASMNGRNEPQSVDSATGRPIFAHNSYIEVTLTVPTNSSSSGLTVYDALLQAISNYNNNVGGINPNEYTIAQNGADNNYVDYMTFDGYELGEFDCGSASGWMYTARTSRTDVASALPNAGLKNWPISNGMYIDWYCTAAYGADFGYSMFDM